ncbi:hypothetical protein BKA70DRAFT_1239622 [Coprinopsis sp. MPI-PUGE-AT-0042]|nr:hypothetical protein BKA70DRAFT_1239622 [Coprinopsis sp. MPI-PUGE-AT-0042]
MVQRRQGKRGTIRNRNIIRGSNGFTINGGTYANGNAHTTTQYNFLVINVSGSPPLTSIFPATPAPPTACETVNIMPRFNIAASEHQCPQCGNDLKVKGPSRTGNHIGCYYIQCRPCSNSSSGYFHFTFPRSSGHPPPEARDTPSHTPPTNPLKPSRPSISTRQPQRERLPCRNKCGAVGNLQCRNKCCKGCCISRHGGEGCYVLNHTPAALTSNRLEALSSVFVRDHPLPVASSSTSSHQVDEATLALRRAAWARATDADINDPGFSYEALFCLPHGPRQPEHPRQLGARLNGLDVDLNGLSDSDLAKVEDDLVLKAIEQSSSIFAPSPPPAKRIRRHSRATECRNKKQKSAQVVGGSGTSSSPFILDSP